MTSGQTVIDQELEQFGWVELIATNSIIDFKSPKLNSVLQKTDKKHADLIDTFIFHLIFYMFFCYPPHLYLVIDLWFGSFEETKLPTMNKFKK